MPDKRVLVVGTTADYIEIMRVRFDERVLFLTDPDERAGAGEPSPDHHQEILADLADTVACTQAVRDHLAERGQALSGVACFDCESLALAADLAAAFRLPFVSRHAVQICRNKYDSKRAWHEHDLPCPAAAVIASLPEALAFTDRINGPVILKPATGAGSELVFRCDRREELSHAYHVIEQHLTTHPNTRMYQGLGADSTTLRRPALVIEQFVEGPEFSCDFIVDGEHLDIIRIAEKIPADDGFVGTTLAYVVPAALPTEIDVSSFRSQLRRAAAAVGVTRSICMLDFIVSEGRAIMLELTPRPGGDCLPPLIRNSSGLDILELTLDFAEQQPVAVPSAAHWQTLAGVRLFANRGGLIVRLDTAEISHDLRVREVYLKRAPGHRVMLPPDDYDSRVLGHVIFAPSSAATLEAEARELAAKLILEMEELRWATQPHS
jgi:biotin carboxylase